MKMGLLKSVDNVPGINFYEYRDNTYYNKYEFRMRVKIPCVKYVWWCNSTQDLDNKIAGNTKRYGSIRKDDLSTVIEHQQALKVLIVLENSRKKSKDLGIRIEGETVAIFSNDLSRLQTIAQDIGPDYDFDYTQVQTSQYAGVKHFVEEPKHKYRIYLKSKRVDDNFHNELRDTMERQKSLFPSMALKRWMYRDTKRYGIWSFRWTSAAHFIDYDDESTLSYLALMHGDILGKKYKLEKRPDQT